LVVGEHKNLSDEGAREYNDRDALLALRAAVEAIDDREQLRRIDSQLLQLSAQIKSKMGVRGRRRSR
jgi:hypothetical protein